jgi:5-(carboxyamino)imidazole ribonucleotide synthase
MTVGIVGAGQLGRMLALAGYPLGLDFLFLDPAENAPAGQVAPQIQSPFTDANDLARLARDSEVLTFDWENISVEALKNLPRGTKICPPIPALAAAQDRVKEKQLFERLRIPTTRWANVESAAHLARAVGEIGLPGVLKTRRLGYDGKGQFVLRKPADVQGAWDALGQSAPLLYEELVPFDYEVSIIGARSTRGEVAIYPLNGNVHSKGILRLTRAPYGSPALHRAAARHLRRALEHFRYTGILTIEFFVRRGRLIANEMAPRVHNSGHWTIEGAETSQFENHLRAILGLPLGATRARGHCAMLNLIGEMPARPAVLAQDGVHLHDYGKAPRPGRKLGHLTLIERSAPLRDRRARRLLASLAPEVSIP